jgi:hypothetical protein
MAIITLGADAANTNGTAVTSGGSVNTLGTAVDFTTSLTTQCNYWTLIAWSQTADGSRIALDLIADPAGGTSYNTLVPNLMLLPTGAAGSRQASVFHFPLKITSGSRVALKARSSGVSKVAHAMLYGDTSAPAPSTGGTSYTSYGYTTSTTNGTTLGTPAANNTKAASYTEITAATSGGTTFILPIICTAGALATEQRALVDIATGSGGAEVDIMTDIVSINATSNDYWTPPMSGIQALSISNGTRVAARCAVADTTLTIPRFYFLATDFTYPTAGGGGVTPPLIGGGGLVHD